MLLRSGVNIVWHTLPVRPTLTSRSNGAQTTSEIIEFASARRTTYRTWRSALSVARTTSAIGALQMTEHLEKCTFGFQEKIQYKLCVIAFKCQHSLAPPYLSNQLEQVARMEPRQRLRSSSSPVLVVPATSSSRMRVIYHNWSATKQRPHPQSVAEISHHSVLSGDRIRQRETSSESRHKDTDQCL